MNKMPLKKERRPQNNKYRKLAKKISNDAICEFIEFDYYSNILIPILNNKSDNELHDMELDTYVKSNNFCNDFMDWEINYLLMECTLKYIEFTQESDLYKDFADLKAAN
jgi:hypothetical protein